MTGLRCCLPMANREPETLRDIPDCRPTSDLGSPGLGGNRLTQEVLESKVAPFETHCVNVCDIVANDLHGVPQ